jgi:hypothetical protein
LLSDKEVKEVLRTLNDFHPLGRNGKMLDVTSAIPFFWGGYTGGLDKL